jgi:D-glycero-D-manno-heptose 1,7-bisphosphate phosphatase
VSSPAVFLDRDGVLNEVVERDGAPGSPRDPREMRLVPDIHRVRELSDAGMNVFIITNQPDVRRGHTSPEKLAAMMRIIMSTIPVDDYRACLHEDADECACRKPRPGMILDLARQWDVDLARSYVIGDMWRDVGAARAAGCRGILIRRPYNEDAEADAVVTSLGAAVDLVLQSGGEGIS